MIRDFRNKKDVNKELFSMVDLSEEDKKYRMELRMLEVIYIQNQGMSIGQKANDELFPNWWFEDCAFPLKIKIIAEAIHDNKRIDETEEYRKSWIGDKII